MAFQSLAYFLLMAASLLLMRYIRPVKVKQVLVLLFSLYFYAYGSGRQTLLFVGVILLTWLGGIWVARAQGRSRLLRLWVILLTTFSPLLLYKYMPFFAAEAGLESRFLSSLTLPIGISFYTFQSAGYVIDVYRERMQPEKNPLVYACFVSFFPQLVAGPIERADALMDQIRTLPKASDEDYSQGFRCMLLGYTLKILVADTAARFVDPVFSHIRIADGLTLLIGVVLFAIQIYCDFNGYSLIAIGSARMMGVRLTRNFDHPYRACTVTDFWRRWHISLTSWFRDYVYIPLGGNRKGKARQVLNTLITFSVSGLWHGANWTFVVWGALNGAFIALEKVIGLRPRGRIARFFSYLYTMAAVCLAWMFFRADTLSLALSALKRIFTGTIPALMKITSLSRAITFFKRAGWERFCLLPMMVAMVIFLLYEYGHLARLDLTDRLHSRRAWVRWIWYILLLAATLYFGQTLEPGTFVYFRF